MHVIVCTCLDDRYNKIPKLIFSIVSLLNTRKTNLIMHVHHRYAAIKEGIMV